VSQDPSASATDSGSDKPPIRPGPGRTQNALLSSVFTYAQLGIALGAAFFVTPLILGKIGTRQYGLWLSSGEIAGYFLLLDFGVFAVLPWLVARADGQQRSADLKRHLVQGLVVAVAVSTVLLLVLVGWREKLPSFLHLTPQDWDGLRGPLLVFVSLLAINLPFNIFGALLAGLQDVRFTGLAGVIRSILGPLLTVTLLLSGHGLYAVAIGAALIPPLVGVASFLRARSIAPGLLRRWPAPTFSGAVSLLRESIGAWLGGAGVQMMERSSAIILTLLRFPAIVPVLVCTSRLGQTLTQMAWVLPDSALIGFAQLGGEDKAERTREVALALIKLNLVLAGGAACLVLALNPAFVRLWVGPALFGGLLLNFLLAAEVVNGSLTHALASIAAVHGHRLIIGLATLAQGVIYIVAALAMSRRFLLEGLIAADLIAPVCSTIPVSLWLLRSSLGLGLRHLYREIGSILLLRAAPCLMAAAGYGYWRGDKASLVELAGAALVVAVIYIRVMAEEIGKFPLPSTARTWLRRVHLI
jgi:hypothetical protein